MRSNTVFAAGIVAASAAIAAPVNVGVDNGPLLPASVSQGVQTQSTGPLVPTTTVSPPPLTTQTTGPLIPTTTASAGSSSVPASSVASSASVSGSSSVPVSGTSTASVSGSSTASVSGTSTASVSGTSTASVTGSSTASVTGSSTISGTGSSTVSGTGSSTVSGSSTASVSGSSTASVSGSSTASVSGSTTASVTGSSTGSVSTGTASASGTGSSTGPVVPTTTLTQTSITTETSPPLILTTITEDTTTYVTHVVPVTVQTGGANPATVTVTVTEQTTVTVNGGGSGGNGGGCAPTSVAPPASSQAPPPPASSQGPPPPQPTGGPNVFFPSAIFNYNVATGAIQCDIEDGLVEKFPANKGQDVTTLVTFTYPAEAAGKQCQFQFYLSDDATLDGSGKIDVFTSLNPAPGCKASWPPGNQRNVHAGRLSAQIGGFASWDATYGSYLTETFPCKAAGTVEGLELVGVYDEDHVAWGPDGSGARMIYM